MSDRFLRNLLIYGSLAFLLVLFGLSVNSLRQVTSTRTPKLTAEVTAGKAVWREHNCNDCHTILGIGGYYAPELTRVVDRKDDAWLTRWLTDPKAVDPAAIMPNQHLSPDEVHHVIALFHWVRGIDTNDWPPQPIKVPAG